MLILQIQNFSNFKELAMNISLDISYYPLSHEHIRPILDFIERLKSHHDLLVRTNGLSTQVFGEFNKVMDTVKEEIRKSFEIPNSVFVLKIVNVDQSAF
jgi:uncharacterized protein YqgV (UPF0045/DUF77 family)